MGKVFVDKATPELADEIAATISQVAAKDISRMSLSAEQSLAAAIRKSDPCFAGYHDGRVAAVWGIMQESMIVDHAFLWMVTTKVVEENPLTFARHARIEVDRLMQHYSMLYGTMDPEIPINPIWLKWLGFEILAPTTISGKLYHPFSRRRL